MSPTEMGAQLAAVPVSRNKKRAKEVEALGRDNSLETETRHYENVKSHENENENWQLKLSKNKSKTPRSLTEKLFRPSLLAGHLAFISLLLILTSFHLTQAADDLSLASRFALDSTAATAPSDQSAAATVANRSASSLPFVWQPLPLRATFRPLNRRQQSSGSLGSTTTTTTTTSLASDGRGALARSPRPPRPPVAPSEPDVPEALALSISERSIANDSPSTNDNSFVSSSNLFGNRNSDSSPSSSSSSSSFFPPNPFDSLPPTTTSTTTTTTTTTTTSTTARPSAFESPSAVDNDDDDDETPTRQPMTRFRPTRAPSEDEDSSLLTRNNGASGGIGTPLLQPPPREGATGASAGGNGSARISSECFECICEASTNCNAQSRCQTSDVRHTRCGLFLISYDQWLSTGLSRELVTREALASDAAADERAFYECVTQRDCAQRLLSIYMQNNRKDCDKDGRIDCYDMAAIHHSGMDQCASETLLDSQYWNDFNACLGFGR